MIGTEGFNVQFSDSLKIVIHNLFVRDFAAMSSSSFNFLAQFTLDWV